MFNDNLITLPNDLIQLFSEEDSEYKKRIVHLDLFNPIETAKFTSQQKRHFASVFYHLRGHFINFMWYIANFTSSEKTKKIIMENIHEEIGIGNKFSHEKLYERFAAACGVDIKKEIATEEHYLPFAREFNHGHVRWLSEHDEDEQFAAFSAYEKLDNIDYVYLSKFAESLNLSSHELTFFKVHVHVEHFDSTLENLIPIWEKSPEKIKRAVQFIYSHQYHMWKDLSDLMFSI